MKGAQTLNSTTAYLYNYPFHSSELKPNQSLRIQIDDAPIKQVDSTKNLGITFDSDLTGKVILMSFV